MRALEVPHSVMEKFFVWDVVRHPHYKILLEKNKDSAKMEIIFALYITAVCRGRYGSSALLLGVELGVQLLHAVLPVLLHSHHLCFMQAPQTLQALQVHPVHPVGLTRLLLQVKQQVLNDTVQSVHLALKRLPGGNDVFTKLRVSSLTEDGPPALIQPQQVCCFALLLLLQIVLVLNKRCQM